MRHLKLRDLAFIALALMLGACNKGSVLQQLKAADCAVETSVDQKLGAGIAQATGAADPVACGNDLLPMLGNLDLCNKDIPAPAGASIQSVGAWKKVGDITPGDLEKAKASVKIAAAVQAMGLVGGIVCPIADGAVVGYLSANIPKSCQGPNPLSASQLNQMAVNWCIAAVPI